MKKILFYGELPPFVFNGISLSNEINLLQLSDSFLIEKIIEHTDLDYENSGRSRKLLRIISDLIKVLHKQLKFRSDYFYMSLPTSVLGAAKVLLLLYFAKIITVGKCKVILHLHRGDFNFCFINNLKFRLIIKLLMRKTHKIVALSEGHKKDISEYIDVNKISVLRNTILEFDLNNRPKLSYPIKKILYMSNYLEDKGIVDLLNAFSSIKIKNKNCKFFQQLELHCYGKFLDENIKSKILSFNNKNDIFINDSISGDQKFKALLDSHIVILPSKNEGQPLIIIEAMYCGKLIACSDVGFVSEMLPPNYPFLYVRLDEKGICSFLSDLKYLTYCEYSRLCHSLSTVYSKNFSSEMHKIQLLEVFD
ncbi:TPA: glycosyltransferase family 4 protein [Yersinia enterocolitica]|uniref:glycosyltransferase family 4 protein n=2 Tax=Yersinia enterocolitica TaxID=630 RepID=UPI0005FD025A|nr:glycosyltransferase family 4 protein [Yersinia enterocolitica]EKN3737182.1 glycosyltransferase family 4 protein [Yersinia enterocolitica]EKN5983258.1 glycosyltransferase [Yersinia enterocolitica]EKN5987550.1 glycosyltransferase [Yersinia enterocolitica]ELI8044392.1 glycosyltransferase family 4 protein [Yersinia enterocolitica]ELI8443937.1 glycosyltransferase family 4 protein [Yersinia enterocolitica]